MVRVPHILNVTEPSLTADCRGTGSYSENSAQVKRETEAEREASPIHRHQHAAWIHRTWEAGSFQGNTKVHQQRRPTQAGRGHCRPNTALKNWMKARVTKKTTRTAKKRCSLRHRTVHPTRHKSNGWNCCWKLYHQTRRRQGTCCEYIAL